MLSDSCVNVHVSCTSYIHTERVIILLISAEPVGWNSLLRNREPVALIKSMHLLSLQAPHFPPNFRAKKLFS